MDELEFEIELRKKLADAYNFFNEHTKHKGTHKEHEYKIFLRHEHYKLMAALVDYSKKVSAME